MKAYIFKNLFLSNFFYTGFTQKIVKNLEVHLFIYLFINFFKSPWNYFKIF